MDLHRATKKPQWENLPVGSRNAWQRVAHRTHGVITLANFFTLVGLGFALAGLVAIARQSYWMGISLLAVGRLFDIIDGFAAAYTRTKSPLGEFLDATSDKLVTIATVWVLLVAGLLWWPVAVIVLLPHVLIAFVSGEAEAHHHRLHPSRLGKFSMAWAWVGLIGLVASYVLDVSEGVSLRKVAYSLLVLSSVLGLWAFVGYAKAMTRWK